MKDTIQVTAYHLRFADGSVALIQKNSESAALDSAFDVYRRAPEHDTRLSKAWESGGRIHMLTHIVVEIRFDGGRWQWLYAGTQWRTAESRHDAIWKALRWRETCPTSDEYLLACIAAHKSS